MPGKFEPFGEGMVGRFKNRLERFGIDKLHKWGEEVQSALLSVRPGYTNSLQCHTWIPP